MSKNKNKPGFGKSFLGFLLTIILMISLISCGILAGVKTTILKGNGIKDVVRNLDLYESISNIIATEDVVGDEGEVVAQLITSVLTEEVLEEVTNQVIDAAIEGKPVDLSDMKDICMENMESIIDSTVDVMTNAIGSNTTISPENLANNAELVKLEEQLGISFADEVLEYVEDNHGSTTVELSDAELETMKEEFKTVLQEEMPKEMEAIVDEIIVVANETVNEIVQSSVETTGYDFGEIVNTVEATLSAMTTGMYLTIVAALFVIGLELLLYKKYINRGVRNTGVAALLAGLFVSLIGAVFNFGQTMLSDMTGTTTAAERLIMKFFEQNVASIGGRISTIGIIYIVIAIACFVTATIIKKKKAQMIIT